jgi:branched-chain amino acid transport system ATP-binding protein
MSLILQTRGLTMAFGGVTAVDGVDFSIADGELRCIIGPNGAGKSTFFKCITGQLRPTKGEIRFHDEPIVGLKSHQIAQLGIGIKMQVPHLFDGLDVWENVWLAARRNHRTDSADLIAENALERTRIASLARRRVGYLAHGQRQLVEFTMVLAGEPKLILLDEPAAGMTNEETIRTAEIIREINRTAAIIVIEHDMQLIRQIADVITVFHQGAVLMEDHINVVLQDRTVRDIYLGKQGEARRA